MGEHLSNVSEKILWDFTKIFSLALFARIETFGVIKNQIVTYVLRRNSIYFSFAIQTIFFDAMHEDNVYLWFL